MSFLHLTSSSKLALSVITNAASSVVATSATGNGVVNDAGGSTITERGFVWGTTVNPTTSGNKVVVAGTTGTYTGSLTSLTALTTYFYRAYAIDQIGTVYGENQTFTTSVASTVSYQYFLILNQ